MLTPEQQKYFLAAVLAAEIKKTIEVTCENPALLHDQKLMKALEEKISLFSRQYPESKAEYKEIQTLLDSQSEIKRIYTAKLHDVHYRTENTQHGNTRLRDHETGRYLPKDPTELAQRSQEKNNGFSGPNLIVTADLFSAGRTAIPCRMWDIIPGSIIITPCDVGLTAEYDKEKNINLSLTSEAKINVTHGEIALNDNVKFAYTVDAGSVSCIGDGNITLTREKASVEAKVSAGVTGPTVGLNLSTTKINFLAWSFTPTLVANVGIGDRISAGAGANADLSKFQFKCYQTVGAYRGIGAELTLEQELGFDTEAFKRTEKRYEAMKANTPIFENMLSTIDHAILEAKNKKIDHSNKVMGILGEYWKNFQIACYEEDYANWSSVLASSATASELLIPRFSESEKSEPKLSGVLNDIVSEFPWVKEFSDKQSAAFLKKNSKEMEAQLNEAYTELQKNMKDKTDSTKHAFYAIEELIHQDMEKLLNGSVSPKTVHDAILKGAAQKALGPELSSEKTRELERILQEKAKKAISNSTEIPTGPLLKNPEQKIKPAPNSSFVLSANDIRKMAEKDSKIVYLSVDPKTQYQKNNASPSKANESKKYFIKLGDDSQGRPSIIGGASLGENMNGTASIPIESAVRFIWDKWKWWRQLTPEQREIHQLCDRIYKNNDIEKIWNDINRVSFLDKNQKEMFRTIAATKRYDLLPKVCDIYSRHPEKSLSFDVIEEYLTSRKSDLGAYQNTPEYTTINQALVNKDPEELLQLYVHILPVNAREPMVPIIQEMVKSDIIQPTLLQKYNFQNNYTFIVNDFTTVIVKKYKSTAEKEKAIDEYAEKHGKTHPEVENMRINYYEKENNVEKALSLLLKNSTYDHMLRAYRLQFSNGDLKGALAIADEAAQKYPYTELAKTSLYNHIGELNDLISSGNLSDARLAAEKLVSQSKANTEAMHFYNQYLAEIHLKEKNPDKAIQAWKNYLKNVGNKFQKNTEDQLDSLLMQYPQFAEKEDFDKAMDCLKRLEGTALSSKVAQFKKALLHNEMIRLNNEKKYKEVAQLGEAFIVALKNDEDIYNYSSWTADAYLKEKNTSDAIKVMNNCVDRLGQNCVERLSYETEEYKKALISTLNLYSENAYKEKTKDSREDALNFYQKHKEILEVEAKRDRVILKTFEWFLFENPAREALEKFDLNAISALENDVSQTECGKLKTLCRESKDLLTRYYTSMAVDGLSGLAGYGVDKLITDKEKRYSTMVALGMTQVGAKVYTEITKFKVTIKNETDRLLARQRMIQNELHVIRNNLKASVLTDIGINSEKEKRSALWKEDAAIEKNLAELKSSFLCSSDSYYLVSSALNIAKQWHAKATNTSSSAIEYAPADITAALFESVGLGWDTYNISAENGKLKNISDFKELREKIWELNLKTTEAGLHAASILLSVAVASDSLIEHYNLSGSGCIHVHADKTPIPETIAQNTIIIRRIGDVITAFWYDSTKNTKIASRSLNKSEVLDIIKRLPEAGKFSKNSDLINAVVAKYGCPHPSAIFQLRNQKFVPITQLGLQTGTNIISILGSQGSDIFIFSGVGLVQLVAGLAELLEPDEQAAIKSGEYLPDDDFFSGKAFLKTCNQTITQVKLALWGGKISIALLPWLAPVLPYIAPVVGSAGTVINFAMSQKEINTRNAYINSMIAANGYDFKQEPKPDQIEYHSLYVYSNNSDKPFEKIHYTSRVPTQPDSIIESTLTLDDFLLDNFIFVNSLPIIPLLPSVDPITLSTNTVFATHNAIAITDRAFFYPEREKKAKNKTLEIATKKYQDIAKKIQEKIPLTQQEITELMRMIARKGHCTLNQRDFNLAAQKIFLFMQKSDKFGDQNLQRNYDSLRMMAMQPEINALINEAQEKYANSFYLEAAQIYASLEAIIKFDQGRLDYSKKMKYYSLFHWFLENDALEHADASLSIIEKLDTEVKNDLNFIGGSLKLSLAKLEKLLDHKKMDEYGAENKKAENIFNRLKLLLEQTPPDEHRNLKNFVSLIEKNKIINKHENNLTLFNALMLCSPVLLGIFYGLYKEVFSANTAHRAEPPPNTKQNSRNHTILPVRKMSTQVTRAFDFSPHKGFLKFKPVVRNRFGMISAGIFTAGSFFYYGYNKKDTSNVVSLASKKSL